MDGLVTPLRVALGLALLALPTGARVQPVLDDARAAVVPAAFAGIPGIKLRYYDVSGRTAADIRASLNRKNSTDPITGAHFDAYTEWTVDWAIADEAGGSCRLAQANVTLALTVVLPRLVDTGSVPPDLLLQWKRYRAALESHEATHVRNALRGQSAMLQAIRRADCATADWAAEDVLAEWDYRDEEYDALTRHGATEGAIFP